MPSMVEAVPKAKMAENDKNVLNCYTVLRTLVNVFNFNESLLMLSTAVFCITPEIGIASFLSCLGVTTKDKVTFSRY